MGKHLTLEDRITIQKMLKEGKSFAEIAVDLSRPASTIMREVKKHRVFISRKEVSTMQTKNACKKRFDCKIAGKCKKPSCEAIHHKNCKYCGGCNDFCSEFEEDICTRYDSPPYVCNSCEKKPRCPLSKYLYDAEKAHKEYRKKLSESRQGISVTGEHLKHIDDIISPRLKKGQSIHLICTEQKDVLNLSERSVYKYLHMGLLSAKPTDLSRTVQRRLRKKAGPAVKVDKQCFKGRTYSDFQAYLEQSGYVNVVEMDTVMGRKGESAVVLSLLFKNCDLQLYFYRSANTARSVAEIFDELRSKLTDSEFSKLFPVILTDRGSEFTDPTTIEINRETGEAQSRVFYCDPMNSNQKAKCERNHEFFRCILPKGSSFSGLNREKTDLITNHINSYPRPRLGDKSLIAVFKAIYGDEIAAKLGLVEIPARDVILHPALLR
jgi:IS30 family transposase